MLGPFPGDAHALEGATDHLSADRAGRQTVLDADLGQQAKGPQTGRLAKASRTLVGDGSKPFALGVIEHRYGTLGPRRFGLQAGGTVGSVGANCVADGLRATPPALQSARGVGHQRSREESGTVATQRRRVSEDLSPAAVVGCPTADQHISGVS